MGNGFKKNSLCVTINRIQRHKLIFDGKGGNCNQKIFFLGTDFSKAFWATFVPNKLKKMFQKNSFFWNHFFVTLECWMTTTMSATTLQVLQKQKNSILFSTQGIQSKLKSQNRNRTKRRHFYAIVFFHFKDILPYVPPHHKVCN